MEIQRLAAIFVVVGRIGNGRAIERNLQLCPLRGFLDSLVDAREAVDVFSRPARAVCKESRGAADYLDRHWLWQQLVDLLEKSEQLCSAERLHLAPFSNIEAKLSSPIFIRKPHLRATSGVFNSASWRSRRVVG